MSEMSQGDAQNVSIQAGQVFQPRTPINAHELFAGRWDQLTAVADAVGQVGLHAVIYGERGVGKTSLANVIRPVLRVFDEPADTESPPPGKLRLIVKVNTHRNDTFSVVWRRAFDEISISHNRPVLGFGRSGAEQDVVPLVKAWNLPAELNIDVIRRVLSRTDNSVFIFDEFDRLNETATSEFTDLIKALSDYQTPVTIVAVGVADTVDGLIEDHASIGRSLVQVHMPRMRPEELEDILKKAAEKLDIQIERSAADRIVRMSLGLPHYTHLVGLAAVRRACLRLSRTVTKDDVHEALDDATKQAEQTLMTEYTNATRSAQRDALYTPVLLACAITASTDIDELGFFQPSSVVSPLAAILPGNKIVIATFSNHLSDFCNDRRGSVLQRTGQPRAFRYRFRNPLLPPYVILKGLSSGLVTTEQWEKLLRFS